MFSFYSCLLIVSRQFHLNIVRGRCFLFTTTFHHLTVVVSRYRRRKVQIMWINLWNVTSTSYCAVQYVYPHLHGVRGASQKPFLFWSVTSGLICSPDESKRRRSKGECLVYWHNWSSFMGDLLSCYIHIYKTISVIIVNVSIWIKVQ